MMKEGGGCKVAWAMQSGLYAPEFAGPQKNAKLPQTLWNRLQTMEAGFFNFLIDFCGLPKIMK